jgi:lipid A 3-O-deacylase
MFARLTFLAGLFMAVSLPAFADNTGAAISVQIENDFFAGRTDRHYTNGLRVSGVVKKTILNKWAEALAPAFPTLKSEDIDAVVVGIGQNMYTPENIASSEVIDNDRPYAGWLYGTLGVLAEEENLETGGSTLKTLSLDLGLTGPASLGEPVQKAWHKTFGLQRPNGWDHQIKTEPGFILTFDYKDRHPFGKRGDLEFDFTPQGGMALGNILTYGAAGATIRFGQNLNLDYGPPRIRPSLPGSELVRRTDEFGWYLFAGLEGRLVLRNIFLQGNSIADSHSVTIKPWVADFQGGAAVTYNRYRLALTYVVRSPEFKGQNQSDVFGALSLTAFF